ncbi:MAG: beta-aspartyl-peptidase [Actinobacteria bacterium]|nr:beta-aspartyl-peptidase [Actinomycetota bacterium]
MFFTLIKNARVYDPAGLGMRDLLLAGGKIAAMSPRLDPLPAWAQGDVVDAGGMVLTPGLIDLHEHLIGGGGEMGPRSRTPEATLTAISTAGITTVVGVLGTDAVTRHVSSLLAKVRSLEMEGLTGYMYTGAYQVPSPTLTGSVQDDIALVEKVVGVKVAVSDHRCSHPTFNELTRLAAEARLGGMLGGKAGLVHVHVGGGNGGLRPLLEVVQRTDVPITQFLPTHMGRTRHKLQQALEWLGMGGCVDITTSSGRPPVSASRDDPEFVSPGQALKEFLRSDVDPGLVTWSTDAQGSLPRWDPATGKAVGLKVGSAHSLLEEVRLAVLEEGLDLSQVLPVATTNPATRLGLSGFKGRVAVGYDADLLLLSPDTLSLHSVWAGGKRLVSGGLPVVFGTFEQVTED